jgi:hypothetical protein
MALCTNQQVYDAGVAPETPAAVVAAGIAEATERVIRFCQEFFEPTAATLLAEFGTTGIAPVPRKINLAADVTSVTFVGSSAPLNAASYRVRASGTPDDIDAIEMMTGYNPLVVGAEPWNGGYSGLIAIQPRILVVGTFGWPTTPLTVSRFAAKLAAFILNHPTSQDVPGEADVASLSVEGYSVSYRQQTPIATTGSREVDQGLWMYRRRRSRVA